MAKAKKTVADDRKGRKTAAPPAAGSRKRSGKSGPPAERVETVAMWDALGLARAHGPIDPDWLRFMAFALPQAHRSAAQLFQDLWVIWETGHREGGCFVEFGACDGTFLSNTLLLERAYGWGGVVAEPNPIYHSALAVNRTCVVDWRCVWTQSGKTVKFRAVAEPEYSAMADVDPADHHERSGRRDDFKLVKVETVSLVDLMTEANLPKRIDYLSLDTEGSEYDILAAFDFDAFDIRLITVEHNHTSRRDDIARLLESKGFRRRFPEMTRWDDWYVRSA